MGKNLVGLILALVLVVSLSAVAFADPNCGGVPDPPCPFGIRPTILPICIVAFGDPNGGIGGGDPLCPYGG